MFFANFHPDVEFNTVWLHLGKGKRKRNERKGKEWKGKRKNLPLCVFGCRIKRNGNKFFPLFGFQKNGEQNKYFTFIP